MQDGVREVIAPQHISRGVFTGKCPFDGPAHVFDIETDSIRQRIARDAVRHRLQGFPKGLPILVLPRRQIVDSACGAKFGFERLHGRQVIGR